MLNKPTSAQRLEHEEMPIFLKLPSGSRAYTKICAIYDLSSPETPSIGVTPKSAKPEFAKTAADGAECYVFAAAVNVQGPAGRPRAAGPSAIWL
jgi:hypothetical protein